MTWKNVISHWISVYNYFTHTLYVHIKLYYLYILFEIKLIEFG